MIIAHPPCTYLTVSGNRWFNIERYGDAARQRYKDREAAVEFFMSFMNARCEHIAVENPIGYMNTHFRKPDQIIHPYMFGHPVSKATCLWLKNLPLLQPTHMVEPKWRKDAGRGKNFSGAAWCVTDKDGKSLRWNDPLTAVMRSKTFPGIAEAMATQWSRYMEDTS